MQKLDLRKMDWDSDLNAYKCKGKISDPGLYQSDQGLMNLEIIREENAIKSIATKCDPNPFDKTAV